MQAYSEIFPNTQDILQPQRVLLPLIGHLTNINLQTINVLATYCFLNILFKHILKFQSRVTTYLLCASLSATMVVQFHYNFGSYPDILCYFFIVVSFYQQRKKPTLHTYTFSLRYLQKKLQFLQPCFF